MTDSNTNPSTCPKVVDRSTFESQLEALRLREKAHTREGDAIAAARRTLPMVQVDAATSRRAVSSGRVIMQSWPASISK